jgi:hypothetical protein
LNSTASVTVAVPVGSFFFPLDDQLGLTQEGFSPAVVRLAIRQGAKQPFAEARADLEALADISLSPMHLHRLCVRVGGEWAAARDAEVAAFREHRLPPTVAAPPQAAVVMLDGGRLQTRAADAGPGVHDPAWNETKVACCLSLQSREKSIDPQPEPPPKFLEPVTVARLAAELKARRTGPGGSTRRARLSSPGVETRRRGRRKRRRPLVRPLVRTVVASLADSDTFGYQMAAEVQRRRLGEAERKGCVCDGQQWNWTLFALHLLPWGFVGILDVLHLLSYLYGAAHAASATGSATPAWRSYERWLRWAWTGQIGRLIAALAAASEQAGEPPRQAREDDPRQVLAEALGYVRRNRDKMNYPEYRRLGLPISSAPVESVIKQLNRRLKGTDKFWERGSAEAMLQLRAAYLSQDDRAVRYAARRRPRGRAVASGRLKQRG